MEFFGGTAPGLELDAHGRCEFLREIDKLREGSTEVDEQLARSAKSAVRGYQVVKHNFDI